jgi:hypothetical protein
VISPSQRPLPDNTQHSQEKDVHASGGFRTHNPSKRAATGPHLRPRDHSDRPKLLTVFLILMLKSLHTHTPTHTHLHPHPHNHTHSPEYVNTPTHLLEYVNTHISNQISRLLYVNIPQEEIQIYSLQRGCKILTVVINGGRNV